MYIFERTGNSFSKNKIKELDPRAGSLRINLHTFDVADHANSLKSVTLEAAECVEDDLAIFDDREHLDGLILVYGAPVCIVDPQNATVRGSHLSRF